MFSLVSRRLCGGSGGLPRLLRQVEANGERGKPGLRSMPSQLHFSSTSLESNQNTRRLFKHNLCELKSNQCTREFTCWKCQTSTTPTTTTFPLKCPECSSLQPQPSDVPLPNYFEILGLKQANYKVDIPELSLAAKRLQRQLHPDLFTQREQVERDLSDSLSSLVNKAIRTLQDPIERGQYLLQLRKVDVVDQEKQQMSDPGFLAEVMDLNERLDELASPQEWKDFRSQNQEALVNLEMELEKAFEKDNLEAAQLLINKMKFHESLQLRLKQVQMKFGVVD